MSGFWVRDGRFDVVVCAGPRVALWPSIGVRTLASLCAEMGLKVGIFGGDTLSVRGVLPLPGTGGMILAQDVQARIHRIRARAIVKVSAPSEIPDPFPGWRSPGLLPLSTAERLRRESRIPWDATVVVLGTGNRAFRFASSLLESGTPEVFCVESRAHWGAKRFAGWEVERRRFEIAGGKLIEATPVRLTNKGPLRWELRLQDAKGVRVLEVARVVGAGPFRDLPQVREHPPGSFLFDLVQTSSAAYEDDVEGWKLEEERGRFLGGKIVKALVSDLGAQPGAGAPAHAHEPEGARGGERERDLAHGPLATPAALGTLSALAALGTKENFERIFRRSRGRLKRYERHRAEPFTPAYQGKFLAAADARRVRAFPGVPQEAQKRRVVASIECFEDIPCEVCQTACPEDAISISRIPRIKEPGDTILHESRCTACGLCLEACPSAATLLVREQEERSVSTLTLTWRGERPWKVSEFATLVNRRGEALGSARVLGERKELGVQLVEVEVPTHLVWEARGLRRARAAGEADEALLAAMDGAAATESKVEITIDGEKRLVRDGIPVTLALFEIGQGRAEDTLFCPDGSCNLCQISVDGTRKLACRTQIHRGMALRLDPPAAGAPATDGANGRLPAPLCPCLNVTPEAVAERMRQGKLQSPEAVVSVTHVAEGRCHGQLCGEPFRRALLDLGLPLHDASQWIDWRFPWSDWVLRHS